MEKKLRSAQRDALENTLQAWVMRKKGGLTVMATGIGKTVYSAAVIQKLPPQVRVLYIVHTADIMYQTKNEYQNFLKEPCGIFGDSKKDMSYRTTVSMIQSLRSNLRRLRRGVFDFVIIDEAHHVAASSYKKVLEHLKPKFVLGLTATPERTDLKEIMPYFDNNLLANVSIEYGIDKGWLSKFKYIALKDNVDYSQIKFNGKQYDVDDLNKKIMIKERDDACVREFQKHFGSKRTAIGFCVSQLHARHMVEVFAEHGISSTMVTALNKSDERIRIKNDLKNGKYRIVFTVNLYNEGVDIPEVGGALFLRPTYSYLIWKQQLGRIIRPNPNFKYALVLDFVNNQENVCNIYECVLQPNANKKVKRVFSGQKVVYNFSTGCQVVFERKTWDVLSTMSSRDNLAFKLPHMTMPQIKEFGAHLVNRLRVEE